MRRERKELTTIGRTKGVWRWTSVAVASVVLQVLLGCSGFFTPVDNSGGGGGGGGTTGNQVYVANQITNTLSGFKIGTGTLTKVNSSPVSLGYDPLAVTVTPANTFVYVGGFNAIYAYPINSDGSLSSPTGGAAVAIVYAAALAVSPDGKWLIALDGTTQQLDIFSINLTTGALTSQPAAPYTVKTGVWQPTMVTVSPAVTTNQALIFAALGTGGTAVFTLNTSTGVAASSQYLGPSTSTTADNSMAVDSKAAFLYIARSGTNGGVAVYSIGNAGFLTPVTGSPFAAGTGTYSVVLDNTGTYVYAANRADGTISGYTIASTGTKLTPLAGSPFKSGSSVQSLGVDSSGKYLLAASLAGSPDLTMYSFDIAVPGQLDSVTSVATDTDPAGAGTLAMTH